MNFFQEGKGFNIGYGRVESKTSPGSLQHPIQTIIIHFKLLFTAFFLTGKLILDTDREIKFTSFRLNAVGMDTALLFGAIIASLGIAAFGFLYFVSGDGDSYEAIADERRDKLGVPKKNKKKEKTEAKGNHRKAPYEY